MERLAEPTLFKAFLVSTEESIMWETLLEIDNSYKSTQCKNLVDMQIYIDAHKKP